MFPHDVALRLVYHSVSDIAAFLVSGSLSFLCFMNHDFCCFFISFGSGLTFPFR
jgi:hypothetical protein